MSHKKVTIASIFKVWFEFDSESPKVDLDMKNNHFDSLSIRLSTLNSEPRFENRPKSV